MYLNHLFDFVLILLKGLGQLDVSENEEIVHLLPDGVHSVDDGGSLHAEIVGNNGIEVAAQFVQFALLILRDGVADLAEDLKPFCDLYFA